MPEAERCLLAVDAYIRNENAVAATRVARAIRDRVAALATHPTMGRVGRVLGTRELVISGTAYIVAYAVHDTAVQVLAVHHGAQQWPESFGGIVGGGEPDE